MEENESGRGGFLRGFFIGSALGAIAGLLLAPKSGKELRSELKQKGSEVLEEAKGLYSEAQLKAKAILDEAQRRAEELKKEANLQLAEARAEGKRSDRGCKNRCEKSEGSSGSRFGSCKARVIKGIEERRNQGLSRPFNSPVRGPRAQGRP